MSTRPKDSVVVLALGPSGSGKSTTINSLLGQNVCKTGSLQSVTDVVSAYKVKVPRVLGSNQEKIEVHVLDSPGFVGDTNGDNERHFHQLKQACSLFCDPGKCYPNIVLLIVTATNETILGDKSVLFETLRGLRNLNITDSCGINIIVVLTHVMSLSRKNEEVVQKISRMTQLIKNIAWLYLHIFDIPVVALENVIKPEGGNQLFPPEVHVAADLIKQIRTCVNRNGDKIGSIVFDTYSIEEMKNLHPETIHLRPANVPLDNVSITDLKNIFIRQFRFLLNIMYSTLRNLTKSVEYDNQCKYLGSYDVLERKKLPINLFKLDTRIIQALRFVHEPSGAQSHTTAAKTEHYLANSLLCREKGKHGSVFSANYYKRFKLDSDMMKSNICEKDPAQNPCNPNEQYVRFRLALVTGQVEIMDTSSIDTTNMTNLPRAYNENTKAAFETFLKQHGTHIIEKVAIGGALYFYVDAEKSRDELSDESDKFEKKFRSIISDIINNPLVSVVMAKKMLTEVHCSLVKVMRANGVYEEIQFTANWFLKWVKDVKNNPIELEWSFSGYPLYDLLPVGPRYFALRKATAQYISGENQQNQLSVITDESSAYFQSSSSIILQNGIEKRLDELGHESSLFVGAVKVQQQTISGQSQANLLGVNRLSEGPNPYVGVKIVLSNNKQLFASGGTIVYKHIINVGYVPTEIRLCKIGDTIACFDNDMHIEKNEICTIRHDIATDVYSPVFAENQDAFILNGVLVASYSIKATSCFEKVKNLLHYKLRVNSVFVILVVTLYVLSNIL